MLPFATLQDIGRYYFRQDSQVTFEGEVVGRKFASEKYILPSGAVAKIKEASPVPLASRFGPQSHCHPIGEIAKAGRQHSMIVYSVEFQAGPMNPFPLQSGSI